MRVIFVVRTVSVDLSDDLQKFGLSGGLAEGSHDRAQLLDRDVSYNCRESSGRGQWVKDARGGPQEQTFER